MIRTAIILILTLAAAATAGAQSALRSSGQSGAAPREVWIASRHTRPVSIELRPELVLHTAVDSGATIRLRDIARLSAADDLRLGEAADAPVLILLATDQRASVDADAVRRSLFNYGWEAHQISVEGAVATEVSRAPLREDGLRSAPPKPAVAAAAVAYPVAKGTRASLGQPVRALAGLRPTVATMSPLEDQKSEDPIQAAAVIPAAERADSIDEGAPTATVLEAGDGDSFGPSAPATTAGDAHAEDDTTPVRAQDQEKQQTLREILSAQACAALNLPAGQVVVQWNEADSRFLSLRGIEGGLFEIRPLRLRSLGQATWEVTLRSPGQKPRKLPISGTVRVWQNQVVAVRPLAQGAIIAAGEVNVRRQLVDQLMPELELKREQVIGMQAARDIDVGMPISARLLQQVPLAKTGQPINVQVSSGAIRVHQTLRALEGGGLGQTVRARNDETRQTFSVRLTGPQQGILADTSTDTSAD